MITTFLITLLIIEMIVGSLLIRSEKGIFTFVTLALTLGAVALITGMKEQLFINIWQFIIGNPLLILYGALTYIVIGVLWSFFKYYSYVRELKRNGYKYEDLQRENNVTRIMRWTGYWPFSLVAHVLGDGLYKLFRWIYDQLSGVYSGIGKKVFGVQ